MWYHHSGGLIKSACFEYSIAVAVDKKESRIDCVGGQQAREHGFVMKRGEKSIVEA